MAGHLAHVFDELAQRVNLRSGEVVRMPVALEPFQAFDERGCNVFDEDGLEARAGTPENTTGR